MSSLPNNREWRVLRHNCRVSSLPLVALANDKSVTQSTSFETNKDDSGIACVHGFVQSSSNSLNILSSQTAHALVHAGPAADYDGQHFHESGTICIYSIL